MSAAVSCHRRSHPRRIRARQPGDPCAIQCQRRRGLYKNHPLYPGRRQLSLLYYLFYGLALVMYLLFLGVELVSALQSGRRVWWQVQDSLDMLSLLLLCFGGVLAVLELIGPTAWLLSRRVADWLKLRSAMRRYLRGLPSYHARGGHVMFSTPTRRLLFLALTTLASTAWLAKDYLPLW